MGTPIRINPPDTGHGRRPKITPPPKEKPPKEQKPSKKKEKKPIRTPSPLPPRLKYPPSWRDIRPAGISIAVAGTHIIIPAFPGFRTFISSIVFTVDDETDVALIFGTFGASGAMDFGGTDEPRGIVMTFGESPIPCGNGAFQIYSSGSTTAVKGFVSYYHERDEAP